MGRTGLGSIDSRRTAQIDYRIRELQERADRGVALFDRGERFEIGGRDDAIVSLIYRPGGCNGCDERPGIP
jgi:hypothetical protein